MDRVQEMIRQTIRHFMTQICCFFLGGVVFLVIHKAPLYLQPIFFSFKLQQYPIPVVNKTVYPGDTLEMIIDYKMNWIVPIELSYYTSPAEEEIKESYLVTSYVTESPYKSMQFVEKSVSVPENVTCGLWYIERIKAVFKINDKTNKKAWYVTEPFYVECKK